MISLLRVEFLRIRSRRLFRWLTVLASLGFLVAGVITYVTSDGPDDANQVIGAGSEQFVQDCVRQVMNDAERGIDFPEEILEDPEAFCRDNVLIDSPDFHFTDLDDIVLGLSVPLLALAWLLGASAMGAEWPNRTMTSLLTWEPRRVRVYSAKLIAACASAFLWVALLVGVLTAIFAIVAATRGAFDGTDADWVADYVRRIVKVGGGGAFTAALGLTLATIGRNTAAALGAGFAYLAIVESVIRGFKPSWSDWLLGDNIGLYLAGSFEVTHLGHSQVAAGLVLLAYAGALIVVSLAVFRTREVA